MKTLLENANDMRQLWIELFPDRSVELGQFVFWVQRNGVDATQYGITESINKVGKEPSITTRGLLAFATACMISYNRRSKCEPTAAQSSCSTATNI